MLTVLLSLSLLATTPFEIIDEPRPPRDAKKTEPLILKPTDRTLVQRAFVPFRGLKRNYACVVGSPTETHYAYDCESGALLFLWKGDFANVAEMWAGRAFNQTAVPAGKELIEFDGRPLLALLPDRLIEHPSAWPDRPDPLFSTLGYELEQDGAPVFLSRLSDLTLRDRVEMLPKQRGLKRTLEFDGRLALWENWLLLADGEKITVAGNTLTITPGGWSIEWPENSPHRPVIVNSQGRQQLRLQLTRQTYKSPVAYTILWPHAP